MPSGSLILLENVTDATNMGAIFRTAAALGAGGILLSPDCCDPLNRRAARVSMGGVFHVPWAFSRAAAWPDDIAARLKAAGFTLIALALREDALSVTDSRVLKAARPALVLGNERRGVTERTLALCDMCAVIPMNNGVDSLNVSHAAAIAMWELIAAPAARRQSP